MHSEVIIEFIVIWIAVMYRKEVIQIVSLDSSTFFALRK